MSSKKLASWVGALLVLLAGVSLVWPANNPYMSGECIGAKRDADSCPVRWDVVDTGSIPAAVVITIFMLVSITLLLRHPRWYTYALAFVPLLYLSSFGVFAFGPVYVPALLALSLSVLLGRRSRESD